MKVITTYTASDKQEYKIVRDNIEYMAINTKYITDGKINCTLRNYQLFISESIPEVIEKIEEETEKARIIAEYIAEGHSEFVASMLYFGESVERAEAMESEYKRLFPNR